MENSHLKTFLAEQIAVWKEAGENYRKLEKTVTADVCFGNFTVRIQHNPGRIVSTGAKTDAASISERKCFLCSCNRPSEQQCIAMKPYSICVNPFPIFKEHFTVASDTHTRQHLGNRLSDMLRLSYKFPDYSIFYNGPHSGASAPDHFHFQMAPRRTMPLEQDAENVLILKTVLGGEVFSLINYLRRVLLFKSGNPDRIVQLFSKAAAAAGCRPGETEPRMNLIAWYESGIYTLAFIPRTEHRPEEFFLTGPERIMFSPGAVDMAGLIIAPRKEDFETYLRPGILERLFRQVSPEASVFEHLENPEIYAK